MDYVDSVKKLLWNIENRIWEDHVIKYKLGLSQEWIIKYNFNDAVSRIYKLLNNIEDRIWQDWGVRYSIKVERDHILLIPLQGEVSRDFVIRYGILSEVGLTKIFKYDLLDYNPVVSDTMLRNTLLGKPRFYKITFS
jgi:hypothetical protein